MISKNNNKKIYVAMSGGVDSSVAAALLCKRGYNVSGVFFKPWSPDSRASFCNWRQDRLDAMRVAAKLGIGFKTWDFSRQYEKLVVQYLLDAYRNGFTPNPDVMCNSEIKFGLFLDKALHEGADYIATGHYVRKAQSKTNVNVYTLLKGVDPSKDQSYFLWRLGQKQLARCMFPVGEYTKSHVRKIAKQLNLTVHNKKDSQGVCFVGTLDMKDFLAKHIEPRKGNVVDEKGTIIGSHEGAWYYTVGQRHGLEIKNGQGPYFVKETNVSSNVVTVTSELGNLHKHHISIANIQWLQELSTIPTKVTVKVRYQSAAINGLLQNNTLGGTEVILAKPAEAIAPGQSAVFYKGDELLGGGTIIQ